MKIKKLGFVLHENTLKEEKFINESFSFGVSLWTLRFTRRCDGFCLLVCAHV